MSVRSISSSEKEINFFITRLQTGDVQQTAEIHEIDMGGWVLFECFLYPAQTVVYVGWDEDAHEPEWIDMEEDALPEYGTVLSHVIRQFKKKTDAA